MIQETEKDKGCAKIDILFKRHFYNYGRFVARNPIWFIIIPPVIAVLLASGLLLQSSVELRDIDALYAPYSDSPYQTEKKAITDRWPVNPEDYTLWSVLNARITPQAILVSRNQSNGNMLSLSLIQAAYDFNQLVLNKITIESQSIRPNPTTERQNFTFHDICMKFKNTCSFNNDHLLSVLNIIKVGSTEDRQNLAYPKTKFGKNAPAVFLGSGFGGVQVDDKSRLTYVTAIGLIFYIRQDGIYSQIAKKWDFAFQDVVENYNENSSNPLTVLYALSDTLSAGLLENAVRLKPRFAVTFVIMVAFAVVCSIKFKYHNNIPRIDMLQSKPFLAIAGVLTALLAIVMAEGLLIYTGYYFSDIVATMPFLILAIGVDDMFILLAAWRNTDPNEPVEERVGKTMSHSAVSITITSITTAVSFAIGTSTRIRAVQIFCLYTSVATICSYGLQITFFIGVLTYSARWELDSRNSFVLCLKVNQKGQNQEGRENVRQLLDEFITSIYVPVVTSLVTKIVTVIIMIIYLCFAILGVLQLKQGLNYKDLMPRDFHGSKFYEAAQIYFWPMGLQVEVIIGKVPDITYPENRRKMNEIVQAFENLTFVMNQSATEFWMRDYMTDYPPPRNTTRDWTRRLDRWSNLATWEKKYSQAFTWKPAPSNVVKRGCQCKRIVNACRFKLSFVNLQSTQNQQKAVIEMRGVAKRYQHFEVSSFMGEYPCIDQYLLVLPTTLQNSGIAIVCMVIIAMIFIPNPTIVCCIAFTILSIDIGVMGYMTWWNVSLDTISMITIVMSIGFSVDYSAHITYGYISASGSPEARITSALKQHGWPVLQGAISTIIGILALASVDSYLVQTFFKTIFLVILFGVTHACFVLPVSLVTIDQIRSRWCSRAKTIDKQERSIQLHIRP